ncbi:MAG: dethiobiotin synthase [Candidatus Omnitrophota bacterium]|nr:dethiobiotin synthase [Candidatus Omnitrophota bacterium]
MSVIFVAGTDTGVGKSVITGLLSSYLLGKGYRVITQKWVQTGCVSFSSDIDIHLKFMRKKRGDFQDYLALMQPYIFRFSSSPHLAASLAGKRIEAIKIKRSLEILTKRFDFVIVEGIGGLLVPLNNKTLLIDVVKELNLPVLMVVGNKLGAINHTLLSLEALKARDIKVLGTAFNNIAQNGERIILENNPQIIKKFSSAEVLGILPWARNCFQLQKQFIPIGNKIIAQYE